MFVSVVSVSLQVRGVSDRHLVIYVILLVLPFIVIMILWYSFNLPKYRVMPIQVCIYVCVCIYACMYVCMYVCVCMYVYMYVFRRKQYAYTHIYIHKLCMHICVYA